MELAFSKMHGAGNDFIVACWPDGKNLPDAATVRKWADRRFGVGFDQLLLVRPAPSPGLDAFYHVFNADGAEVEQCGNGVRCIARYLSPDGGRKTLLLASRAGTVEAVLGPDGEVSVNLGEPDFAPAALPFRARQASPVGQAVRAGQVSGAGQAARAGAATSLDLGASTGRARQGAGGVGAATSVDMGVGSRQAARPGEAGSARQAARYRLEVDAGTVEFGAVSLGNPHAVIPVEVVDTAPVGIIGPQLQAHPSFPEGVNVGFVEYRDAANIRLRVFERGAGETVACGTGAAAAAAVGRLWGELGESVKVEITGGVLRTAWPGPGHAIWLSGPAVRVFEGRIEI